MEVSARKLPLIPPHAVMSRLKRRESSFGDGGSRKPEAESVFFFPEEGNIAFTSGCYARFLPRSRGHGSAMADLVCTLTQRRWKQLPQRSHRANGLERKQGAADVFKLWLVIEFIVPRRHVGESERQPR